MSLDFEFGLPYPFPWLYLPRTSHYALPFHSVPRSCLAFLDPPICSPDLADYSTARRSGPNTLASWRKTEWRPGMPTLVGEDPTSRTTTHRMIPTIAVAAGIINKGLLFMLTYELPAARGTIL